MKPPSVTFQFECVRAFMTTFRQPCPRDFVDARTADAELRWQLISEEHLEWQRSAPMSEDLLDALVDLQYVTIGTFLAMGLKYTGKGYGKQPALTGRKMPVDREVGMALAALRVRPLCRERLQPALSDLVDVLNLAAAANGFDMDAAFAAVHAANMSKADWFSKDLRPPDSREDRLPSGQIVVYNKAGKVVKPPGFKPANLQPYLTAALRLFESPTSAAVVPVSSAKSAAADPCPAPAPPAPPAVPESSPQSHSKSRGPKVVKKTGA